MGAFAVRDLREHTGDLVRNAENGAYSVVSKYGKPLFVALPFNADLCCAAPNSLLMIVDERRALLDDKQARGFDVL